MTSSPTALETLAEEASMFSRKNIAEPSPISTEVGSSPDAQTDRSVSGDEPSFQGRLQLDLEAMEEGTASCNSGSFVLLTVPRERTPNPGSLAQSVQGPLPTVLGRRDQSKNSSKSVAASYNVNPTSPHSVLTLPRSPNTMSWVPRWRREESRDEPGPGLAYLDTAAASRESDITLRKWSVGVRTLLQLQGGHGSYWLCFSALASVLLVMTALYAVFMAPRDDPVTITWRKAHGGAEEQGCHVADYVGFYLLLTASSVAGCAACLMLMNSCGSAHILSAAGYALLNWLQGLIAAILPAHERAKAGCAYGMMQKTFAPLELSTYDKADYYKEYYGVIIVRTLLFLAGLIWMQHLMVRRLIAVETTSRRRLAGRCLSTSINIQKVGAIVACGVSMWIGNSDAEGVDMERAIFMWDEEKSKECLKEILEGEMPEVVNGAMLVMEEVVWPDPRDAKNWPEFLRQVAGKFLDDQVNADEPFVPPENAREHCLYLMNPTQADAYLEKLGLKKVGKTGKQLMQDDERNEALGMDDGDKVYESFPDTAVLFIKDLVKKAA